LAVVVCAHCGKEHEALTKFCPKTGKPLGAAAAARPTAPTPAKGAAAARATKLMYLPPEARLPGAALPRAHARTEVMNAAGPIVAPAAPRSLVTAPRPAPASGDDVLARAQTTATPALDTAARGATEANPVASIAGTIESPTLLSDTIAAPVLPETVAAPILPKATSVAPPTLTDATLAVPTLPHWDEAEPPADESAAPTPVRPEKSAGKPLETAPQKSPDKAAAKVAEKSTAAAETPFDNQADKTIETPAATADAPKGDVNANGQVKGNIFTSATTAAAARFTGRATVVEAGTITVATPSDGEGVPVNVPSVVVDPAATASEAGADDAVPSLLAVEKSPPESWVTAPRPGDSRPARGRSKSQPGSPTTPASALPSGSKAVDVPSAVASSPSASHAASGKPASIPSWASLPSADDMRRPSAAFTAFDGPRLDFVSLLRKTGLFYWSNRLPLLIMAAILLGPVSLLTSGIMAGLGRNGALQVGIVALLLGFLVSLLVMGLAWPITSGAISLAVARRLQGGQIDPAREYRICAQHLLPLASALLPASLLIAIGYFLLVIPGLGASLFFALVPTVVLLEGKTGVEALKRSAEVMKDLLGRALGLLVLFVVVSWLVRKLVTLAVPGAGFFDLFAADLASLILAPLPMIALTLLYLEHRREQEALTAEALQAELDTHGV
jgi:hypothetical protein